ncbi:MAG: hypothetical protein KBC73_16815 [Burkholderiaceae bacterium]|nr:hypothetical protein [Burkholderiaceae bacterium]
MPAIQPHEVLARVVAWHNRHPLALRITAAQVHSLGQVVLPFASDASDTREPGNAADSHAAGDPVAGAGPQHTRPLVPEPMLRLEPAPASAAQPEPEPEPETLQDAAEAQPQAANDDDAVELDLGEALSEPPSGSEPEPGAEAEAAPDLPPDPAADEATQVLAANVADVPDAAATLIELPLDDAAAAPADAAEPTSALATRLKAARERAMSGAAASPVAEAAAVSPAPPAPPLPRPAAARRGRLSPLFDAGFMWPLSPARVARWVRAHGSEQALVPAELRWPERELAADLGQLAAERRAGRPHLVQRHVLSAAIAVGDRRIRLLIDGQGRVLGPRAFDRRRVQVLATLSSLALVVLAAMPWWLHRPAAEAAPDQVLAAASAVPAERAAEPASAAAEPVAQTVTQMAAEAASAATGIAGPAAVGHATKLPLVADAAPATPSAASAASAPPPVAGVAALPEVVLTHEPPPLIPQMRASGPLARIRPVLDDDAKLIARQRSAAARQAKWGDVLPEAAQGTATAATTAALPPGPVYALVTAGARQKDGAEAQLAQMMSVRASLPPPVGDHGEVMPHQGRWRAAWWPFASADEAERARSALAVRGVRAEVIEF